MIDNCQIDLNYSRVACENLSSPQASHTEVGVVATVEARDLAPSFKRSGAVNRHAEIWRH